VHLTIDGEPIALPTALDASGYRIVQEALTNTRKHGGDSARASVRIVFHSTWLEIDVVDGGQGTAHANGHHTDRQLANLADSEGTGNGLRGIRERVELLGGQVTAGPRPEGGFRVHAIMPLPALS
jgi:signal transduction histidine kinase